ncbi:MAG TPA: hypothetical protein VK165_19280 [Azonexus sp.]|nr:hypothetical protein [Azonexus sp.]
MQTISSDKPASLSGAAEELAAQAGTRIDKLTEGAHKTIDRVADTAVSTARRLGLKRAQLAGLQRRWTANSCQTVCRHPVASLAIALAAGVLISHFSESRKDNTELGELS